VKAAKVDLGPLPGEELQQLVQEVAKHPAADPREGARLYPME